MNITWKNARPYRTNLIVVVVGWYIYQAWGQSLENITINLFPAIALFVALAIIEAIDRKP